MRDSTRSPDSPGIVRSTCVITTSPVATSTGSDTQVFESDGRARSRGPSGVGGESGFGGLFGGASALGGGGVSGVGGGSLFGGGGGVSLLGEVSPLGGGGVSPAPDVVVESSFFGGVSPLGVPPPSPPLGVGSGLVSRPFGFDGMSTLPPLRFFNAFAASPKSVSALFSNGISAWSAFTSRFVRFAIFDAVFATAATTCGTTHVRPIPRVNSTCNAQLIRCPISSAMMSRTRARTAPTTSPAVFTPEDAPSQPFWALSSNVATSPARFR